MQVLGGSAASEGTPWRRPAAAPRWVRRALVAAIAGLLVGASGALYLRQGPHELTVDDAVARFRAGDTAGDGANPGSGPSGSADDDPTSGADGAPGGSSAAAPPVAPGKAPAAGAGTSAAAPSATATARPMPAEGVYVYDTTGYEETDALGGSRHDYPAQTTSTVRKGGCGWTERWEPLAERWDESQLCPEPGAWAVRSFKTYHQFFQRSQQQDYDCPAGSHVGREHQSPGATWTWSCSSSFGKIVTNVTYVGPEQLTVGGAAVTVDHLRYESVLTGSNRGTQVQERWVSRQGHSVRIKTDIDAQSDSPFGTVGYQEHYTITLASLTPRR